MFVGERMRKGGRMGGVGSRGKWRGGDVELEMDGGKYVYRGSCGGKRVNGVGFL